MALLELLGILKLPAVAYYLYVIERGISNGMYNLIWCSVYCICMRHSDHLWSERPYRLQIRLVLGNAVFAHLTTSHFFHHSLGQQRRWQCPHQLLRRFPVIAVVSLSTIQQHCSSPYRVRHNCKSSSYPKATNTQLEAGLSHLSPCPYKIPPLPPHTNLSSLESP